MALTKESAARWVDLPKSGRVRYYEHGSGPVIVLLHGSGPGATGWSNFSGNIEPIADAGFRVLAVDMPGWGESPAVTVDEMDHVATAIELLDALGLDKVALVGNSMGGHTAIRFASEHPERTTHLITMGAPYNRDPLLYSASDGPSEGLKVLMQAYAEPTPARMKQLVEIMTFDKARFATDELARLRSDAALANPEHLRNYLDGRPRTPIPLWADPAKVRALEVPTLLMHGRDDRVVHYEHSLRLVSLIKDSRLHLVNQCGHWLMIEHAEEFNTLVADFVRTH